MEGCIANHFVKSRMRKFAVFACLSLHPAFTTTHFARARHGN